MEAHSSLGERAAVPPRMIRPTHQPRRGQIWWGSTPGRPTAPHQPRPLLVISVDARNRHTDHVLVIPVFTTAAPGPTRVPIARGVGGPTHESVLCCEEISTVEHDNLDLEVGPLGPLVPDDILEQVCIAVHNAINP